MEVLLLLKWRVVEEVGTCDGRRRIRARVKARGVAIIAKLERLGSRRVERIITIEAWVVVGWEPAIYDQTWSFPTAA